MYKEEIRSRQNKPATTRHQNIPHHHRGTYPPTDGLSSEYILRNCCCTNFLFLGLCKMGESRRVAPPRLKTNRSWSPNAPLQTRARGMGQQPAPVESYQSRAMRNWVGLLLPRALPLRAPPPGLRLIPGIQCCSLPDLRQHLPRCSHVPGQVQREHRVRVPPEF